MFKNLSENLNVLMAKARLNSSELARLTGIPATTIKRIKNNEHSNPTLATLLPLTSFFSISLNELLGCDGFNALNGSTHGDHSATFIPLFSWQECILFDSIDYSKHNHKILTAKNVSRRCYSLKVDNTIQDFLPKNGLLIVEPEKIPQSGDYIIVSKLNEGPASIKKYITETGQAYIKSLVEGLGIIPLASEYRILGVVIQYRVDLV